MACPLAEPSFRRTEALRCPTFRFSLGQTVEHDFTNYPGNIMATMPYELVIGENQMVQGFRERCYHYLGSSEVYTNTIITVYEREIRLNKGRNYPEALFVELPQAWEKEKPSLQRNAQDSKVIKAPEK